MPLHVGKGRTVGTAIAKILDYVKNPEKTDHGQLITSYQCDSRVADAQFLQFKNNYIRHTGRVRGSGDVIAYHLRQSFRPGEITPEEANRLGCELAKRFTKGNHAFIVCTHIDKAHAHNHIIWAATDLEEQRKFRNFWGSTKAVRRLNDTICIENGYYLTEATFEFSADGTLMNFILYSPVDVVRVVSENVKTMTSEEMINRAKEQLSLSDAYEYGATLDNVCDEFNCTVSIAKVEYGLTRTKVPNTDESYYYVPSAAFFGNVEYCIRSTGETFYYQENIPLLMLNAVDGTIIPINNE